MITIPAAVVQFWKRWGRAIIIGAATFSLILLVLALLNSCSESAKTKGELDTGRAAAAIDSGADAAGTAASNADKDQVIDTGVRNAQEAIRNAPDAGSADRAARRGLCDADPDYCE